MGNSKVLRDFSSGKYTDNDLSQKAGHIVEKMTGNEDFKTPDPTLETITSANTEYINSLKLVVNGSKEDTVRKNQLRAVLEVLLKQLADYVQRTSEGDEALILSTGFDVNKKPTTVGPLAKPENVNVKPGDNKGSLILTCDVVANAYFYEVMYTECPVTTDSVWIQRTSTKRKLQIDGLMSGKEFCFKAAGAGSDPSRIWSNEVYSFVL